MRKGLARLAITIGSALAVASAAACGQSDEQPSGTDGPIGVVASTNVWADVAAAVGGSEVEVASIVAAGGDPHSHQVSARDAATLRDADLVVSNGGGYDDFVDQALDGADRPRVVAVDVHAQAGHDEAGHDEAGHDEEPAPSDAASEEPDDHGHDHSGANEHVWYDLHTVESMADALAERLTELRPSAGPAFEANAAAFRQRLEELHDAVTELAAEHTGASVASTEPVAHYLLDEAGLTDATPPEFVEAIEEENDPSAAAVAEIQRMVAERQVAVLVHNPQTETPVVADLVGKARDAGVPVVELTETLPDGQDYLTWMGNQIAALHQALSTAPTR